jgi:hypothetical protein
VVNAYQLAPASFQDDHFRIAVSGEGLVKQDAFELGVRGPVAWLLVQVLHVIQAGLDGVDRYARQLAAEVHNAQGLTPGQRLAHGSGRRDLLDVCSLDGRHAGELVTFLGQSVDLPGHDVHCPHDQFVLGQLAGRYLFFAHDISAVLADGWEDYACYPVLEGAGFRLAGPHDQLVEAGLADPLRLAHG